MTASRQEERAVSGTESEEEINMEVSVSLLYIDCDVYMCQRALILRFNRIC